VEIGGLVENPVTDTISDLLDRFETVQRVSLLRSVEGYFMVLPWQSLLALGLVLAAAQHGFCARHNFAG
jgi:DMSO/TMAO reductase YedYZ molybdopterin-dependent catalytic subunit